MPSTYPRPIGQHGLHALERLYLALLVHAQYQRVIRWVQIQADDISDFFNEERIVRELGALGAMRLQPKERHITMHGALREARLSGQATSRPMGFASWLGLQRGVHQDRDLLLGGATRPTRLHLVVQSGQSVFRISGAPHRHRRAAHSIPTRNGSVSVSPAIGQTQNNLRPPRQRRGQTSRACDRYWPVASSRCGSPPGSSTSRRRR
jgi:hypothetical protein